MNMRFPTMLRKMWSGSEVQEWIDVQIQQIEKSNVVVPKEWLELISNGHLTMDEVRDVASNLLYYGTTEDPEYDD